MSRADLERIKREADELDRRERLSKEFDRRQSAAIRTRTAVAIITKDPTRLFTTA